MRRSNRHDLAYPRCHAVRDKKKKKKSRSCPTSCFVALMSEVAAIVNTSPITAMSSGSDGFLPLTPSMMLTQKTRPLGPLTGEFVSQDLYSRRRRRKVQYLADRFWSRWRKQYVHNLQAKPKWKLEQRNLTAGKVLKATVSTSKDGRKTWQLTRKNCFFFFSHQQAQQAENLVPHFWSLTTK